MVGPVTIIHVTGPGPSTEVLNMVRPIITTASLGVSVEPDAIPGGPDDKLVVPVGRDGHEPRHG